MRPDGNSTSMTPGERLAEVASILASGILQIHTRAVLPSKPSAPKTPSNSAPKGLDVLGETVLSVHNG